MKLPYFLFIFSFICLACSKPKGNKKKESGGNTLFHQAFDLLDEGKSGRSFLYFNKAKELFLQTKDSLRAGICLVNMGMISTDQGDNFGGQELALNAIPYFDDNNPEHYPYIRSNLNNLGIASYNLKQYNKAVEFYNRTLNFTTDSAAVLVIKNNIANAYRQEEDYTAALKVYQEVLAKEANPVNFSRVLSNFAFAKWLQDPNYTAAAELLRALNIRKREKDLWGVNSSYAQFADYYMQKQPDSALYYTLKMYASAKFLNSPDDRLAALQKLIKLSDPQSTKRYFDLYQHLEDSLQTTHAAAKNQFALIRYETEKHKADNLKLQKENTERITWVFSLLLLMAAASVIALIWYKKRKEHLQLESQNEIKEGRLRTSKKVHDVVANGLYRLMSEIENSEDFDENKILDDIEALYEQSRDISYENENQSFIRQVFETEIKKTLDSFNTENTEIVILGNTAEFWERVGREAKSELKYVLLELMVNMKKHSCASSVAIRFENSDNILKIHYADNGSGSSQKIAFGNGLRNTENRINTIGGNINFDSGAEGGLKILISFPPAK